MFSPLLPTIMEQLEAMGVGEAAAGVEEAMVQVVVVDTVAEPREKSHKQQEPSQPQQKPSLRHQMEEQ